MPCCPSPDLLSDPPQMPDQVTVNEYPPGVGIAPHVDTHSAFEEAIRVRSGSGYDQHQDQGVGAASGSGCGCSIRIRVWVQLAELVDALS